MKTIRLKSLIRLIVLGPLLIANHDLLAEQPLELLNAYDIGAACLDKENSLSTEICYAFILGVVQAHQSLAAPTGRAPTFCLPDGVSRKRALGAIRKHFRRNLGDAEQAADVFVKDALMRAFPCE